MKKGQVLEGVIETVEFPNKGIVSVLQHNNRIKTQCSFKQKSAEVSTPTRSKLFLFALCPNY